MAVWTGLFVVTFIEVVYFVAKVELLISGVDKAPFSKTTFSENALGPNPAGADPQKSRPRRPLENRKRAVR